MSYFSATATADLALITLALREHPDLPAIAAGAEADVIEHFTQYGAPGARSSDNFTYGSGYHLGNGYYVALRQYNPDPAVTTLTEPDLVTALKRVIATVVQWRLSKTGENEALQRVTTALGVGKERVSGFASQFPPTQWEYPLKRWDIRDPVFVT